MEQEQAPTQTEKLQQIKGIGPMVALRLVEAPPERVEAALADRLDQRRDAASLLKIQYYASFSKKK
jgi:hypothetical protein